MEDRGECRRGWVPFARKCEGWRPFGVAVGCVLLLAAFATPLLEAQTAEHRISLSPLGEFLMQRDNSLSRVPRYSWMAGGVIRYEYSPGSFLLRGELEGGAGGASSFTDTTNGLDISAGLAFANMYRCRIDSEWFSLWLGGVLRFNLEGIPSDDPDALRFGWHSLLAAGPVVGMQFAITPDLSLGYESDIAALGVLWRPHAQGYNLNTEEILEYQGVVPALFENPRFASLHNVVSWNNAVSISLFLSRNWGLQAEYRLKWVYVTVPRVKKSISSTLGVGVVVRL